MFCLPYFVLLLLLKLLTGWGRPWTCPSRTPPLRTSSSVLTSRGRWLRWVGSCTRASDSSTGRRSGEESDRLKGFAFFVALKSPFGSPGSISPPTCRSNFGALPKWFLCLPKSRCRERKEPWPQSTCLPVNKSTLSGKAVIESAAVWNVNGCRRSAVGLILNYASQEHRLWYFPPLDYKDGNFCCINI